jgi:anaerobic ribonucleoside-triphosphate reductase activating protein
MGGMEKVIRIAGIVKESIVDGPGIRLTVFAQGCKHNCLGCHNPHTHDFEGGSLTSVEDILRQMKSNPLLDGITLSGGEPFEQAEEMGTLAQEAKILGYNVMTYTGYTFEYILQNKDITVGWDKLLRHTDTLVDGKFEIQKKMPMLQYRGSENQRIIDIQKFFAT